jgi:hypothetical protein
MQIWNVREIDKRLASCVVHGCGTNLANFPFISSFSAVAWRRGAWTHMSYMVEKSVYLIIRTFT